MTSAPVLPESGQLLLFGWPLRYLALFDIYLLLRRNGLSQCAIGVNGQESRKTLETFMSGQVVLYFEDQADALRFALAAGSVMAGDGAKSTHELIQKTARVSRIRLNASNAVKGKASAPERVA
jgi:hypothetical protein